MRIDAINRMYETYRTQAASPSSKVNKINSKDEIALSDTAKDFTAINKMLSNVPDVRMDKVEKIKQQMKSGNYNVSAQEVAEKMLSQFDIKG